MIGNDHVIFEGAVHFTHINNKRQRVPAIAVHVALSLGQFRLSRGDLGLCLRSLARAR